MEGKLEVGLIMGYFLVILLEVSNKYFFAFVCFRNVLINVIGLIPSVYELSLVQISEFRKHKNNAYDVSAESASHPSVLI